MLPGASIVLFALLGFGVGALHFMLLRHNVDVIVTGDSALFAVAATIGRFAVTAAIFVLAAKLYGVAIVWMLAGFVVARMITVRTLQAEA